MTFLSRLYGVRPAVRHPVRVQRDIAIPAADGARLLATRHYPADLRQPPLTWLRAQPWFGDQLATGRSLHPSEHEIFHDHDYPSAVWLSITSGAS